MDRWMGSWTDDGKLEKKRFLYLQMLGKLRAGREGSDRRDD